MGFPGRALSGVSAFFAYFYFLLTLPEQQVLGYSPLKGGLRYLPFGSRSAPAWASAPR